jgi:hypothetical protein
MSPEDAIMKSSLLVLLVPCAMLAACNRADTPERSDMRETPMSAPASPGVTPGDTTRTDIQGTNTQRPDGGSADDARRNQ